MHAARQGIQPAARQIRPSAQGPVYWTLNRGYYKGEEILACDGTDPIVYIPKPLTSGSKARGRHGKQDFRYLTETGEYLCPAGSAPR